MTYAAKSIVRGRDSGTVGENLERSTEGTSAECLVQTLRAKAKNRGQTIKRKESSSAEVKRVTDEIINRIPKGCEVTFGGVLIFDKVVNATEAAAKVIAITGRRCGVYRDHDAMDAAFEAGDPVAEIYPFRLYPEILTVERWEDFGKDPLNNNPSALLPIIGSGRFAGT
jgi:hypothetical protein